MRVLDYNITFTGNPDLTAEESETFNVGVAWKPTDSIELTLDYWDILQENKIDEEPTRPIYTAECNNQASTVCVRSAPLAGDTLGPLQTINARSSTSASRQPPASTSAATGASAPVLAR